LKERVLINEGIFASELRVVGAEGENIGVISKEEALKLAREQELDLIEISPKARPPVAKIMDYGKFQYDQKKKQRDIKAKAHVTETKIIQIKIGTGEHDLNLKKNRIDEWLSEGHRIKVDLFLRGRYKYMEFSFLKGRLESFLKLVTEPFKIADPIKKSPKGLSCTLERDGKIKAKPKASAEDNGQKPVLKAQAKAKIKPEAVTKKKDENK